MMDYKDTIRVCGNGFFQGCTFRHEPFRWGFLREQKGRGASFDIHSGWDDQIPVVKIKWNPVAAGTGSARTRVSAE
jgi:hypothetical protein